MNSIPDGARVSPLSVGDSDSLVYTLDRRVFRSISKQFYEAYWQNDNGRLLRTLANDGFIPQTTLIKHGRDQEPATLEHQKIAPIVYPYEWSFSMLQDAGALVMRLLSRLEAEGLTLKDCHPYNILFNGCQPRYVDICSLTKAADKMPFPIAFCEFITHYIAPLCMWSRGNEYLARQSLAHLGVSPMPSSSWEIYIEGYSDLGLARFFNRLVSKLNRFGWRLARRLYKTEGAWNSLDAIACKLPSAYRSHRIKPTHQYILRLLPPSRKTVWSDYHRRSFQGKPSERLQTIVGEAMCLGASSAVDLACNEGLFSEMLAQKSIIRRVISIDRDSQAIDSLYQTIKRRTAGKMERETFLKKITPILSDFLPCGAVRPNPDLAERVRCDSVFALALTHHLLLSQGLKIEVVVKRILDFTTKYAFIEFMPLGLWDGNSAPPIPDWYSKINFETVLSRFARIKSVRQTEANRVLYVCEKQIFS